MLLLGIGLQLFFLFTTTACADKQKSHDLLSVVNICRMTRGMSYEMEETAHLQMTSLRHPKLSRLGPGFRHTVLKVERVYVEFLKRIQREQIGRGNLGRMVTELTWGIALECMARPTKIDMSKVIFQGAEWLMGVDVRDESFGGDVVRQEYYKMLKVALAAYYSTSLDYKHYKRIASFQPTANLLPQLKDFIGTKLGKYDHSATFPDTIICLSLLQYHNYLALLDSDVEKLKSVGEHYRAAAAALDGMQVKEVLKCDFSMSEAKGVVLMMPQEKRGPMMIPVSPKEHMGITYVRIGIKDVDNALVPGAVYSQMVDLGVFSTTKNYESSPCLSITDILNRN